MKLCTLLVVLFLTACSSISNKNIENDESLRKQVIGTWAEYVQDGKIKVYTAYLPDGRFHTYGYLPPEYEIYFYGDGHWNIRDGKSCIEVLFDNLGLFESGHTFCNEIVELNDSIFTFRYDGVDTTMREKGR